MLDQKSTTLGQTDGAVARDLLDVDPSPAGSSSSVYLHSQVSFGKRWVLGESFNVVLDSR